MKGLISLPPATRKGSLSVEEAISQRRSVRRYSSKPLTIEQLSQMLWATQGLTKGRFRTVPSAGSTYPLEIFALIGNVEEIEAGIYHYIPEKHALNEERKGNFLHELAHAALDQSFIAQAPLNIIICALFKRTSSVYGHRGERYVFMEVGHAGQNIYLQAEALRLSTVAIGAFDDERVIKILGVKRDVRPLYIMPVGFARALRQSI